jgi:hypothetical protein
MFAQQLDQVTHAAVAYMHERYDRAITRCMFMNKSYRSTIEISELAQRINRNPRSSYGRPERNEAQPRKTLLCPAQDDSVV